MQKFLLALATGIALAAVSEARAYSPSRTVRGGGREHRHTGRFPGISRNLPFASPILPGGLPPRRLRAW